MYVFLDKRRQEGGCAHEEPEGYRSRYHGSSSSLHASEFLYDVVFVKEWGEVGADVVARLKHLGSYDSACLGEPKEIAVRQFGEY